MLSHHGILVYSFKFSWLYLTTNTIIKPPRGIIVNKTISNPYSSPHAFICFMKKLKCILYTLIIYWLSTIQIRRHSITLQSSKVAEIIASQHARLINFQTIVERGKREWTKVVGMKKKAFLTLYLRM